MLTKLRHGYALYTMLRKQKKVPITVNMLLIGAILYLLMPIDFIFDAIPILGQLDDIVIIGTVLNYVYNLLNKKATPADKARANAIDV